MSEIIHQRRRLKALRITMDPELWRAIIAEEFKALSMEGPMATKRDHLTEGEKYALYRKQKGKCSRCRKPFAIDDLTDDHFIPVSKQGSNDRSNRRLLCGGCNRKKGANDPIRESKITGQTILDQLEGKA